MDPRFTWWIFLFYLISQVHSVPHLSKQDLALLATDENPKCFTRNLETFTCFWEAPVAKSYYFIYRFHDSEEENRCNVTQQTFEEEEKKVLHICAFPSSDVFLFIETELRVVDMDTNTTIYSRNVSVEDQHLLYPPSNISLHPTGEVGQMLVVWANVRNTQYEICYNSKHKKSTVKLVTGPTHKLTSLAAGENCTLQMRARPGSASNRLWSEWSSPVTAMVPQSADEIDLRCHTPDLYEVLCKWSEKLLDGGRYNLHYRQTNRSSWSSWKLCSKVNDSVNQCVLYGEESTVYQVYLSTGLEPFSRTFYMKTFSMNSSIQTEPPGGLQEQTEDRRLCLNWDPPLLMISQYLMYQIQYQLQGENEWKLFTVPSSKSSTCLDVQLAGQYSIQVRAQPDGSIYSGYWSDWSKPLTAHLPSGKEWIFIVCIPVALLIIALAISFSFSRYFSKVKKSLWPSVPNLNKVLESFLADISGSHWEPTFNVKQSNYDAATSVLEILSERDAAVTEKTCKMATSLSQTERGILAGEKNEEDFGEGLEMAQDYVILNTNDIIPCFTGNDYVYKDVTLSHLAIKKISSFPDTFSTTFPESTTNILNHSYLLLAEQSELQEYNSACCYTNIQR
ncbi:thrombopoietin receptor-like isoform X1 [Myxocyprinus asiaticus]|uniref:thrombopoietin receptor-like isoform X1 n=2 Tax=Myxocyprinus asiaticus TaxID=70543 RepID=UPI002223159C|nr:thrombopoietin receptor-like isoform X1 [Myxocyprinus asiaticus]